MTPKVTARLAMFAALTCAAAACGGDDDGVDSTWTGELTCSTLDVATLPTEVRLDFRNVSAESVDFEVHVDSPEFPCRSLEGRAENGSVNEQRLLYQQRNVDVDCMAGNDPTAELVSANFEVQRGATQIDAQFLLAWSDNDRDILFGCRGVLDVEPFTPDE